MEDLFTDPVPDADNDGDTLPIFVDEAGDPTLFEGRRGKPLTARMVARAISSWASWK